MLDFRPPLDNKPLIGFVKLMMPMYMKLQLNDTEVQAAPGAVERFKSYAGKRAMVCPNHSNRHDPQVMFTFSNLVDESFNFVAAREVFEWGHGLNGWWLQRVGCYSVVRGAPDRESFKTTKRVLVEGKKKLVLFPEGEISRQNDTLMALESGAAQLTFWAVEELAKHSKDSSGKIEPVYIIPIAIKYTFPYDIKPHLRSTFSLLEEKLNIRNQEGQSFYVRLRKIAEVLLDVLEKEYKVKPNSAAAMNDRIAMLRQLILDGVARQLNITLPVGGRQLEMVRILRNSLDDQIYSDQTELSDYQKTIHEEHAASLKPLYADLDRVVNFIAIYDGYIKENLSQERYADLMDRLEREITRQREPSHRGPRLVLVDVGAAINVSEYFADYKKDKRGTINKITENIFGQISDMLKKLDGLRTPLYIE